MNIKDPATGKEFLITVEADGFELISSAELKVKTYNADIEYSANLLLRESDALSRAISNYINGVFAEGDVIY